jgi:hypothetical protein
LNYLIFLNILKIFVFRVYTNSGFTNIIRNKWGNENDSKLIENLKLDKNFSTYMKYKYDVKKDPDEKNKTLYSNQNKIKYNPENSSRNFISKRTVNAVPTNKNIHTNQIRINSAAFNANNPLSIIHSRPQTCPMPQLSEENKSNKFLNTNSLKTPRTRTETGTSINTRILSAFPLSAKASHTQRSITYINSNANTVCTQSSNRGKTNRSQIKKESKRNPLETNGFLFNDYYEKYNNNFEIKDDNVNKLYKEVKVGPYATQCPSCNRRNLEFYDQLNPQTAMTVLNLFKKNKIK